MQTEFTFTNTGFITDSEEWRFCTNTNDYQVSSFGRVRNTKTLKILRGTLHDCGYRNIGLNINGQVHTKLLHRLIAEAFLEKPSPKHTQVNHLNKIRDDNRSSNLEWMTPAENMLHSWDGRRLKDREQQLFS